MQMEVNNNIQAKNLNGNVTQKKKKKAKGEGK
jgi:hypothetical protein